MDTGSSLKFFDSNDIIGIFKSMEINILYKRYKSLGFKFSESESSKSSGFNPSIEIFFS